VEVEVHDTHHGDTHVHGAELAWGDHEWSKITEEGWDTRALTSLRGHSRGWWLSLARLFGHQAVITKVRGWIGDAGAD